jgi:hypothetical protein
MMCNIKLQKFQYASGKIVRLLKTSGKEPLFKSYCNGDTNVSVRVGELVY